MSKTRTTAVFFGVIALVALVIWNRPHSATERPPFDGIARGQMQLSMPDGGAVVSEFAIRRGSWSFTASWRFRTDMSWDEFQTWVSQRMSATYFGPDELDVKHIEFRRHRAGETHVLALKKVSEAGPLVVAGEFVGMRIRAHVR